MKIVMTCTTVATLALLSSGCVQRTIMLDEPNAAGKEAYGSTPRAKTGEQKLLWFWQDEYHNR